MKIKRLYFADVVEIQEAVTDELKKVQKEEFSAAFQKLYDSVKACIYANWAYFEFEKKICFFLIYLQFKKKKIIPKNLDHTVYAQVVQGQTEMPQTNISQLNQTNMTQPADDLTELKQIMTNLMD